MGSLLQERILLALLKNFMLSRLWAAIDINDVLHYYQFHFVLIFFIYIFKLKSYSLLCACFPAPCTRWNHDQTVQAFFARFLVSFHMIHSRNLLPRLHIK